MNLSDTRSQIPNPYMVKMGGHGKKEGADLVTLIDREFQDAINAHRKDMDLMYQCIDAYDNFEGGLWDKKKLWRLKEEDREARVFEVIGPKLDILTGAVVSELPDLDWTPIEGEKTTTTESLKDSWYTDKELTNSERQMMLVIRDGLTHIGWGQLYECYKYGKPVLGFKRIAPGFLIPSAYWIQDSDREMQHAFKIGYFTPHELMFRYRTKIPEIRMAMEEIKKRGMQEMPQNADAQRRYYEKRIADHHKVIEKHWLEHVETSRLVGPKIEVNQSTGEPTGIVRWVPFPITDNREMIQMYAQTNNIPLEHAEEVPYTDTIHWVTTICPELSPNLVLENAKSKIQVKGLPFYCFTVHRSNGRNKGVVAAMLDPARTISERESMVTDLISKANGGMQLYDKNIFSGVKERQDFEKNHNNPSKSMAVDLSQSKSGQPIVRVPPIQYPSQVLDQISRMYETVVPMTSRVSDSMSAITESGKSGILFEKEIQVNKIGNLWINKSIKQLLDNLGEGYFFQWQITYAGIEREISSRDGRKKTTLNERVVDNMGKEMIRNHVSYVSRCRTVVTESVMSPTYQMRWRLYYSDLLQTINPEINPEHYNFVFNQYMRTMDLPDKVKGELETINNQVDIKTKMNFVNQITQMHAGTKMATLQTAQVDIQLRQIMEQLQAMQQMGAPQPAIPEQLNDAAEGMEEPQAQLEPPVQEEQVPAMGSDVE